MIKQTTDIHIGYSSIIPLYPIKINETIFTGKSSIVTVQMNGKKELLDVKIDLEQIEADDVELLQDMITVALNDAMKQIDKETESKMGKYTKGMPGLF